MECGDGGDGGVCRECSPDGSDDPDEQLGPKRRCRWEEDGRTHLTDPREVRRAILHTLDEPLVFRGYLSAGVGWPCLHWGADDWGRVFAERELNFRMGPRVERGSTLAAPQWETGCLKGYMTYVDFLDWAKGLTSCKTSCDQEVNCDSHWAYFDYYYMRYLQGVKQIGEAVDWGVLGFPERGVRESTLWIGSPGANTPCHIDTYGCNLVAQVKGRKRWVLFPKSQSQFLSPTRIPYEESSIYSSAGFPRPSLQTHPKLALSRPHVVTLEPGDALFVPRHWWHSVENLDFAISINTWLELPSDREERVKESLVMYQVASLCQGVESVDLIRSLFNPNMMDVPAMTSSSLLNLLLSQVLTPREAMCGEDMPEVPSTRESPAAPGQTPAPALAGQDARGDWGSEEWLAARGIHKVNSIPFVQYQQWVLGRGERGEAREGANPSLRTEPPTVCGESALPVYSENLKLLMDVFTDPRVIDTLKAVLDEKLETRASKTQTHK